MPRTRYTIHDGAEPHFVTCTVVGWLPIFTRPETAGIVLDSWRFLHENDRLALYGYVIMVNHVHLVASASDLAKELRAFKAFTARQIIDLLKARKHAELLKQLRYYKARERVDSRHQLWQTGSHPQQILSEDMMRQKLEYIHDNPVRRGYVDEPTHWRHSSARNYEGQPGLVAVMTDW